MWGWWLGSVAGVDLVFLHAAFSAPEGSRKRECPTRHLDLPGRAGRGISEQAAAVRSVRRWRCRSSPPGFGRGPNSARAQGPARHGRAAKRPGVDGTGLIVRVDSACYNRCRCAEMMRAECRTCSVPGLRLSLQAGPPGCETPDDPLPSNSDLTRRPTTRTDHPTLPVPPLRMLRKWHW